MSGFDGRGLRLKSFLTEVSSSSVCGICLAGNLTTPQDAALSIWRPNDINHRSWLSIPDNGVLYKDAGREGPIDSY